MLAFVLSLNLKRRHLNESQRAMVASRVANLPKGRPINASIEAFETTQSDAADALNVSRPSIQRARQVQEHGAPELVEAVDRGDVAVSTAATLASLSKEEQAEIIRQADPKAIRDAAKAVNAERNEERRKVRVDNIARISAGNTDLPTDKKYPIILADPPWKYENPPMGASNRAIENHYSTMSLKEICNLAVADVCADDCLLYLGGSARIC